MKSQNDDFMWLLEWFYGQCDGDWEHGNGVKIETLGNPGWAITISLYETELSQKKFEKIKVGRSEHDWFCCYVEGNFFHGSCGNFNFFEILNIFRNWAEKCRQSKIQGERINN